MSVLSLRRVASAVVTVVAVVVLAAFVVQAVPGVVGADASYVVLSGSMEPTISPGDSVIVRSVDPGEIESGDVITYVRGDDSTPVTHRVVEVVEGEDGLAFRTQGDANDDPDPQPVPAENLTGEVWFAIPYIGHVVMFANTPRGLATLVGLPVVAFVASELYAYASRGSAADASGDSSAPSQEAVSQEAAGQAATGQEAATTAAAATEAGEAADAAAATDTADAAGDDAIAVTPADLKISSVGFTALAAYSGYVAFRDPSPFHVGVFAGAALIVVFVAAVLVLGGDEPAAETDTPTESAEPADADQVSEAEGTSEPDRRPGDDQGTEGDAAPEFLFDDGDTVTDGGSDDDTTSGGGGDAA